MNPASAPARDVSSATSTAWKWTLLLIPLLTAAGLFWLRHIEVNALAQRPISSYGSAPTFQLVNQDGHAFGSSQLAGKIWIADFIFTACPGPCPMISSRMSEMQRPLQDTDVHLVSFTVDPERDTPEVLRDYAEKLKAQPGRWDFLTGAKAAIYDVSRNGFKLAVADGNADTGTPVHSTRMVLVDRRGVIRGYYDATAPDAVTKVLADASHLLHEQPK